MSLGSLHVNMAPVGGAYTAARGLVDALCAEGLPSELVAPRHTEWQTPLERATRAKERVNYRLAPRQSASKPFGLTNGSVSERATKILVRRAAEAKVLHLHWLNSVDLALRLIETGRPTVWTLHDEWPFTGGCHYDLGCDEIAAQCQICPQVQPIFRKVIRHRRRQKELLSRGGVTFICPSSWIFERLRKSMPESTAVVVPNSVGEEFIRAAQLYSRPLQAHGTTTSPLVVGLVASDWRDVRKGALSLIPIAAKFEANDVTFAIAGRGAQDAFPEDSRFHFEGYLENRSRVADFLSKCDVYLHLATADNLPSTLVEASTIGVPSIALDAGGVRDVVLDGRTGYVVQQPEEIPRLIQALSNAPKRAQFSQRAQERSLAKFSPHAVAEQMIGVYDQLESGASS